MSDSSSSSSSISDNDLDTDSYATIKKKIRPITVTDNKEN